MDNREQARKLLEAGEAAALDKSRQSNADHGYQLLASACYADPAFGEALYANGNAAADLKRPHAAVALYRRALECELPDDVKAKLLSNLGWQLNDLGRYAEAIPYLQQSTEFDPKLALPYMHLAMSHRALDQTVTGLSCARKCVELSPPGNSLAEFQLAFALLFNGNYAEGLKAFESRFAERLHNFLLYPYPKWKGENGKTLFLVADQGLGDTLSYARFVEQAARRCRFVHMCVQAELRRVFEHAFRHLPNLNFMPSPSNFPGDADAWTTFVSLPYALGLTDDEIIKAPHIDMPHFKMSDQWKVPDRKLHIGIAWAGSPLNDIDRHRNIPIHHFLELYRVPGIQLYSLQVDERKKDLNIWGCAPVIRDLSGYLRDIADTVSVLDQLDLVVTVESALGHIAGSIDKPCYVPYSWAGRDYRGGSDGSRVLWYKNHMFVRQSDNMAWEPVFDEIVERLKSYGR